MTDQDLFPADTKGLAEAADPERIRLGDGDRFALSIRPVRKRFGVDVRMLAYNGSIPGPTLHVAQGARIDVDVRNDGDVDTTVHWHGLRLENRFDGVPHETQEPIPVGGAHRYQVDFPDAGFYWYHPHIREDFAQEMGLYGGIVVDPADPGYWPPVDRDLTITLDDLLLDGSRLAAFSRSGPNFTAMGRFGNLLLINGETTYSGTATVGEVVRLYLVNTANTRLFNFALQGARMKLVGGDSGRYERETFVETVLLAPSERAVVDVLFEEVGEVRLEHRTPQRIYGLGTFTVLQGGPGSSAAARSFEILRTDPELAAERRLLDGEANRPPDKTLAFVAKIPALHDADAAPAGAGEPMSADDDAVEAHDHDMHMPMDMSMHHHGGSDGLEWEDLMPEMNRASDRSNTLWQIVDRETGAVNGDIAWGFTVGDRVKIRLVNEVDSDHPMHHPFHIHGAGRFLVLARNGTPEPNLVWKDTVLVAAGETTDILLDVSNPGIWMAHCHIAEHTESGMMFSFTVARGPDAPPAIATR